MDTYQGMCKGKSRTKGLVFSMLVVLTGTALLLRNTGTINEQTSDIIFSWPMLIIAIGIMNLNKSEYGFGIILLLVGGYFLYTRTTGLELQIWDVVWPVVFIVVGFSILFAFLRLRQRKRLIASSGDESYIEEVSVFGGAMKRISSRNFMGGSIVNIFGGSRLDMRDCELADDKAVITFVSIFGGSGFTVPADWNVQLEMVNIVGAVVDKREKVNTGSKKTLVIKGVVIFGGGEIISDGYPESDVHHA